jgi:hypothetical protein
MIKDVIANQIKRSTYLKPYPRLMGHVIDDSDLYDSLHYYIGCLF